MCSFFGHKFVKDRKGLFVTSNASPYLVRIVGHIWKMASPKRRATRQGVTSITSWNFRQRAIFVLGGMQRQKAKFTLNFTWSSNRKLSALMAKVLQQEIHTFRVFCAHSDIM